MKLTEALRKKTVRSIGIALAATTLCGELAHAQSEFDPNECARIQDVKVPFEVSVDDTSLTFTGDTDIKVSDTRLIVDDVRFDDPALAARLHGDLRSFLQHAAKTATASAEFSTDWESIAAQFSKGEVPTEMTKEFLLSLTDMCEAILTLDRSQSMVLTAFPVFVVPVMIDLSE